MTTPMFDESHAGGDKVLANTLDNFSNVESIFLFSLEKEFFDYFEILHRSEFYLQAYNVVF